MIELIESLAKRGVFGEGDLLNVEKVDAALNPQFASQLKFLNVHLKKDSTRISVPIVVKIQPMSAVEREIQDSDSQFQREVLIYTKILPFLGCDQLDLLPKIYCGNATNGEVPEEDIVILENLNTKQFMTAKEKIFLDQHHIKLAMKKLGAFHGLSYKMKNSPNNKELLSLGKSLAPRKLVSTFDNILVPCFLRGFKALKSKLPTAAVLDTVPQQIVEAQPHLVWDKFTKPVEPFGVIIHGDFNRNNFMFKYGENGEVNSVKFLDFQNSLYGDPSTDMAFILYMNTTQELRATHWDEFLDAYWDGLTSIEPNPGFTQKEFLDNFAAHALYGYLPCCFFLPMMMNKDVMPLDEFHALSDEEQVKRMLTNGGEEGTKVLSDIVEHLLNRGYLDEYLSSFS